MIKKILFILSLATMSILMVACANGQKKNQEKLEKESPAGQALFSPDKNYQVKTFQRSGEKGTVSLLRVEFEGQDVKAFAFTDMVPIDSKTSKEEQEKYAFEFESSIGNLKGVEPRGEVKEDSYYLTYVVYTDKVDWKEMAESSLFSGLVKPNQEGLTLEHIENYAKELKFQEIK